MRVLMKLFAFRLRFPVGRREMWDRTLTRRKGEHLALGTLSINLINDLVLTGRH